jgi:hypothetical protein
MDHHLLDKKLLKSPDKETPNDVQTEHHDSGAAEHPVVSMQRTMGNAGLQRMLQGSGKQSGSTFIQAKMTVTPADDKYEQEADAVAKQVVQQANAPATAAAGGDVQRAAEEDEMMAKRIQRANAGLEEEELAAKRMQREAMPEDELAMKRIQRVSGSEAGFEVGGDIERAIDSKRGGGQPLPTNVQRTMENAMGADFSDVRVHTDSESDALNQQVDARAFTVGNDVFFREGEYKPESSDGQELLAHELTHTVQQGAAPHL